MSESSRTLILKKIEAIVGQGTPKEERLQQQNSAKIARSYVESGQLDQSAVVTLFCERARECGASVHEISKSALREMIGQILGSRGKQRVLVPSGVPQDWLPAVINPVRDTGLSFAEIDQCDGVLTGATLAVAVTGTVILTAGPEEGARRLTLLPDYHLCVVREDQIRETVPEAIRELSQLSRKPITLFSGPSGTVDIEMTKVKGVHGPRTVDIIVLR
jgi:L-lactate dehydrogenase complex protein LldG